MDTINDRAQILTELRCASIVLVNFIKADGTHRSMRASLNPAVVPKDAFPKKNEEDNGSNFEVAQTNLDVIRCYDIEKKGWRSFRVDSVTNWSAF